MASFLETLFGTGAQDPKSQAMAAFSTGLLNRDLAAALAGANNVFAQAPMNALKMELLKSQVDETKAQAQERALNAQKQQAALEQAALLRQNLPSLFGQMSPGAFEPSAGGMGPVMPRSEAPQGQFDVMKALSLGMDPKTIGEYAGLANIGRQKVARTVDVAGPNGEKLVQQVDEYGAPVGKPMTAFEAAQMVNLGDRSVAVVPRPGLQLTQGMSPEAKASNALGWANNAATLRGQDLTDARAREVAMAGRVPAGYRQKPDGTLEFIPGGPADPNAAKKAAPTEFQGKSATFGARAQAADKIISSLEGSYSPSAVNTKTAIENLPGVGGVLGAASNLMLSDASQKAEQAQRDFVNAVLRQESGAVISDQEFANAKKQYFPQPGDSDAVKRQKAANRQLVIQGFMNNARPGAMDAAAQPMGGASSAWDANGMPSQSAIAAELARRKGKK